MCSHCGECFCFGVAKLDRVLFVVFLFWLVCSLVLGLIIFVFVSIVLVLSVIGEGIFLVYDVMSCMLCFLACIPAVFFIVVLHLNGWVSCSCLFCYDVISYFHLSPFVAVVGVGGIAAIAMVLLMIL